MNNLPLQPLVFQNQNPEDKRIFVEHAQGAGIFYTVYGAVDSDFGTRWHDQMEGTHGKKEGFESIEEVKHWIATDHYPSKMQSYVKPDSITDIANWFNNFTQWSYDRQIIQNGNVLAQGLKLVSEVGELADNLAKGRDIKDDIGDCFVVLNNLAHMTGLTLEDCMAQAWFDIKDRKGTMNEHGVFIKQGDI